MTDRIASPRYRQVLALADSCARKNGHDYVGVEHLLLAILDEDQSLAAAAIRRAGCSDSVRRELEALMDGHPTSAIHRP